MGYTMNINSVTVDPHITILFLHPSHLLGLLQVYLMCSVPGLFMLSYPRLLIKVCCLNWASLSYHSFWALKVAALNFSKTELRGMVPLSPTLCYTLSPGLQSRTAWIQSHTYFLWPSLIGFPLKTLFKRVKCGPLAGNWPLTHHLSISLLTSLPLPQTLLSLQPKKKSSCLLSYSWLGVQVEAHFISRYKFHRFFTNTTLLHLI